MGIIWGSLLTIYIVYIYSTSAWRMLEVNKKFKTEKKVSCFESHLLYRMKRTLSISWIMIIPLFATIILERLVIGWF